MKSNAAADANADMNLRIERIQNHKNVQGLVLINSEGNPVRSNMDNSTSLQYTRHTEELRGITQHVVRDLDPKDDLLELRLRTRFNEIMILPGERRPCILLIHVDKRNNKPFF